jgi:hypothetical protein
MMAYAGQEERLWLQRLDCEVVQLSNIAYTLDKLGELGERHAIPVAAVSNDCCESAGVRGPRTESNLSQHWQIIKGWLTQITPS